MQLYRLYGYASGTCTRLPLETPGRAAIAAGDLHAIRLHATTRRRSGRRSGEVVVVMLVVVGLLAIVGEESKREEGGGRLRGREGGLASLRRAARN